MPITIFTRERTLEKIDWDNVNGQVDITVFPVLGASIRHSDMESAVFKLDGTLYAVMHRGYAVWNPPRPSHSRNTDGKLLSRALYLAERNHPEGKYLLQYLPPYSETSYHYHTAKTELFYSLVGKASLSLDDTSILLDGTFAVAHPRQWHQLRTGSEASVILLDIRGFGDPLKDDHHFT